MGDLIPRADDFGAHPEASAAILAACRDGWLTNVSVLVTAPGAREAVAALAPLPGVCRGLHLCLSSEWARLRWGPATSAASLRDADGFFPRDPGALHRAGVALDVVMAEVEAQLALAERIGLRVDYLDEHMGCSWIGGAIWGGDRRLHDHLQELCDRRGLVYHLDCYLDLLPNDAVHDAERLVTAAAEAVDTKLFMTHPAFATGAIAADRLSAGSDAPGDEAATRERDYRMLADPTVGERLRARGVRLLRFDEAPRRYRAVERFRKA